MGLSSCWLAGVINSWAGDGAAVGASLRDQGMACLMMVSVKKWRSYLIGAIARFIVASSARGNAPLPASPSCRTSLQPLS